jgi:hypothetical protein
MLIQMDCSAIADIDQNGKVNAACHVAFISPLASPAQRPTNHLQGLPAKLKLYPHSIDPLSQDVDKNATLTY